MKVEYDRSACAGWFQCIQDWDEFEMNMIAGKADLKGSEEVRTEVFVREVPRGEEEAVIEAAKRCPVDAICVYDDGEQVVPEP